MHIHPLQRAAALARVEDGAVHNVGRRPLEVRVGPHIGRVVAAQLQVHAHDAPGGGLLHGETARRRARKAHLLDARVLRRQLDGVEAAGVENLEDSRGEAGLGKGLGEAVGDEGRLGGGFEDDGTSGEEGGDNGVDGDEIWKLQSSELKS